MNCGLAGRTTHRRDPDIFAWPAIRRVPFIDRDPILRIGMFPTNLGSLSPLSDMEGGRIAARCVRFSCIERREVVEWINKLENQAQSLGGVRRSCRQPISERQRCSESDTKFRFRTESLWLTPKAMA
jgi:hypothetical protein